MNLLGWCFGSIALVIADFVWSEVSLEEFTSVNEAISYSMTPMIVKANQGSFDIIELFDDFGGTFKVDSARKLLNEKRYIITLTGKIPQSATMISDGYAIVACHEFGHILGGAPRQTRALDKWSSVEGQADYYATSECMWKYVESMTSFILLRDFSADSIARCSKEFRNDLKKTLGCLRILSGIQAMAEHFNRGTSIDKHVSLNKKDSSVVQATLQKYPTPQCRIDTWMAGLFKEPRPACWFKD